MSKKEKCLILLFALFLFVGGCLGGSKKPKTGKVLDKELASESEDQKIKLLKQIERKFENPKAHYALGQLYQEEGLWDRAEWEYNRALAFDPVHYKTQAAMVQLLKEKGDAERAAIIADMYMSQASVSAKHSLLLGRAFQGVGDEDYALSCYLQAVTLAPNSVAVNKQIAYYYLAKKDTIKAEQYLRRTFQLDSTQAEVAGELGRLGVEVKIPRKKIKNTKKLDKLLEE